MLKGNSNALIPENMFILPGWIGRSAAVRIFGGSGSGSGIFLFPERENVFLLRFHPVDPGLAAGILELIDESLARHQSLPPPLRCDP